MVPSFGKRVLLFLKVELIEEFHPVFFVSFLGTGITGNILYGFPYPAQWLKVLGIIMFCLTVLLFVLVTTCLVVSWVYYPLRIYRYHIDPTLSIYFAVYSMGYNTIINGIHLITHGKYPIFYGHSGGLELLLLCIMPSLFSSYHFYQN